MPTITITSPCFIDGQAYEAGTIVDVSDADANTIVGMGRAVRGAIEPHVVDSIDSTEILPTVKNLGEALGHTKVKETLDLLKSKNIKAQKADDTIAHDVFDALLDEFAPADDSTNQPPAGE